jgi:hypothetical protein
MTRLSRLLEVFVRTSNLGIPHEMDFAKFYRFVIADYDAGKTWNAAYVCKDLVRRGMPNRVAERLAEAYKHGMLTLRTKDLVAKGDLGHAKLEVSAQ